MTRRIADGLKVVAAFLIPLGLCALWVPVRTRLPNTDLALVLVLAVLLVGAAGRRLAVFAAGVSAAFWFDFFDTRPFEHPSIQRTPDLETTLVLAAVRDHRRGAGDPHRPAPVEGAVGGRPAHQHQWGRLVARLGRGTGARGRGGRW